MHDRGETTTPAPDAPTGGIWADRDFHLKGNYAPVPDEAEITDLAVEGAIPPSLDGLYVRNGPNPHTGTSPHWFMGDGMLHGIRLKGGKALWYRNRYVKTRALDGASLIRPDFTVDHTVGVANTHIVPHNGGLFALVESSFPTRVSPELETLGPWDFGGKLNHAFTAHPKICPRTGEMHAFGYGFSEPYLVYHRIAADGSLIETFPIPTKGPVMMHDFALSERHVVFLDLPVIFDGEQAFKGTMPFKWSDSHGARLGVMPRGGTGDQVRWYDIDPCYVFHVANAFEDETGGLVIDVARYPDMWRGNSSTFSKASLHRWRIDPVAGRVSDEPLDDQVVEFLRVDDRLGGRAHRHIYAAAADPAGGNEFTAVVKYDLTTGMKAMQDFGPDAIVSEFVFVPGEDGPQDDAGWLLGFVYSARTDTTDFLVMDAQSLSLPPVARVRLPRRVPQGFHGSWMDLSVS
ncbi:MAG: carotenoid oxygenase family protein [Alphaproteobacteria bacterium]